MCDQTSTSKRVGKIKACVICSAEFKVSHHLQRYCTKKCYLEGARLRNLTRVRKTDPRDLKYSSSYIPDDDIVIPKKFLVRGTPGPSKVYLEGVNFGNS